MDKRKTLYKRKNSDRRKHSIRSWLLFPYLGILLFALIIISGFLIYANIRNSTLIFKDLEKYMVDNVNEEIKQSLQLAEQLNQINIDMLKSGNLKIESQNERETYFTNILKSYPQAAMSFIGLPDGSCYGARKNLDGKNFVLRNDESTEGGSWYFSTDEFGVGNKLEEKHPNFDPRTRPWYQAALEAGKATYSHVYMHFVFNEPTITASTPVYSDDGQLIGVFAVNYLLSWMDNLLDGLLIGENGIVYMVDEEGDLISTNIDMETHKLINDELVLINIDETDNEYIKKSKEAYKNRENNSISYINVKNKRYYVNRADVKYKNIDWKLYFLTSEDDFLKNIKKDSIYAILTLSLFTIISIVITIFIAEKIGRPIEELSRAAEKISSSSFKPIYKNGQIMEIDSLTDSLNKSGETLSMLVANLEKQVIERTKELEEKNKLLKNLSYYDGLTGICNRRKFNESYSKAWYRAMRHGKSIGIIMIDIDCFKKYNDGYGHIKGDECLKKIAQKLQEKLRRSTDLLARYGGEEFVVLTEGIKEDMLKALAEDLRRAIEELNIEHKCIKSKHVTVSLGYACVVPIKGMEKNELIERADMGLYKAKKTGKNRVSKG